MKPVDDLLQCALDILNLTDEDAKKAARSRICFSVDAYKETSDATSGAPTATQVRASARKVATLADSLRKQLDDPFLATRLSLGRSELESLQFALSDLEIKACRADRSARGGTGNVMRRFYANPTANLVAACGWTMYLSNAKLLSGTVDGKFCLFAATVYELATEKEAGRAIEKYAKHFGAVLAKKRKLHERGEADHAALCDIQERLEVYGHFVSLGDIAFDDI